MLRDLHLTKLNRNEGKILRRRREKFGIRPASHSVIGGDGQVWSSAQVDLYPVWVSHRAKLLTNVLLPKKCLLFLIAQCERSNGNYISYETIF